MPLPRQSSPTVSDGVVDEASSHDIGYHDDADEDDDGVVVDDDDDDDDDDDVFPTSMRLPWWSRRGAGFGSARSPAEAAVIATAIILVVAAAGTAGFSLVFIRSSR